MMNSLLKLAHTSQILIELTTGHKLLFPKFLNEKCEHVGFDTLD